MTKKNGKKIQKYAGVYNDIAELLGEEAAEKVYENMSGQQVTFPRKLYSKEYVVEQSKDITDSAELKKIAIYFGYTERRLKQLLKQEKENHKK